MMRTLLTSFLASFALLPAASASAAITELPLLGDAKPSCAGVAEDDCRVLLARQTAFQAKVGTAKNYATVKQSGHLVGWSIALLGISSKSIKSLTTTYAGPPRAGIVVLDPLGKSQFKVYRKGPMVTLTRYLGTTPTFALPTAIPVKKGQIVAITVPTWAPVLQLGVGSDTSWRGSRSLKEAVAGDFGTQRALVGATAQGNFAALFQRARLTYGATFIPTPVAK